MAEEMLKFYNNLNAAQQKEVYDFVIYLYNKNIPKPQPNEPVKNTVMELFGAMSAEDAAELRNEKIKFKETEF